MAWMPPMMPKSSPYWKELRDTRVIANSDFQCARIPTDGCCVSEDMIYIPST